ncbi:MAG: ribulose-phosphate 3-epimerase, partial [Gracilibacteraceae bacterium]|nr:ribulose-phosphate 3-epimerase [Gracilibacteraceae bacterium]
MMCADYGCLEEEIRRLEAGGIDGFHIDIMDGRYVPNFGMGIHDLRYIRSATGKSVETHLMIADPLRYVDLFVGCGADVIYVHPESEYHPSTTLERIIAAGAVPGIALNPGTSVESVIELLGIAERVLVMSVNPGHAGQVYLPYVGKKIRKLIDMKEEYGIKIY